VPSCAIVYSLAGLLAVAACHPPPTDPPAATADFAAARGRLIDELHAEGIRDARVLAAMGRVPRHEFVLPQDRSRAYANQALPIGAGQTISQPYVVALMTQLLELHGDERVLEIGTGSGYQAAVLAELAREVYSIEIDATLAASAHQRLQALGYGTVRVRAGDGFYGWEEVAPFDAVLVTCESPEVPARLVAQLKEGGRLVMPLSKEDQQVLVRVRKQAGGLKIEPVTEVLFVPMQGAVRTPTP
jgi:protein-L-isoaspartate(D-aspartate) O-methyltransferase